MEERKIYHFITRRIYLFITKCEEFTYPLRILTKEERRINYLLREEFTYYYKGRKKNLAIYYVKNLPMVFISNKGRKKNLPIYYVKNLPITYLLHEEFSYLLQSVKNLSIYFLQRK